MFNYKCVNPRSFVKNLKTLLSEIDEVWKTSLFTKKTLDEVLPNLFTIKVYKCCCSRSYAICICKL